MDKKTERILQEIVEKVEETGKAVKQMGGGIDGMRDNMDWLLREGYIMTDRAPVRTRSGDAYMGVMPTEKGYEWGRIVKGQNEHEIYNLLSTGGGRRRLWEEEKETWYGYDRTQEKWDDRVEERYKDGLEERMRLQTLFVYEEGGPVRIGRITDVNRSGDGKVRIRWKLDEGIKGWRARTMEEYRRLDYTGASWYRMYWAVRKGNAYKLMAEGISREEEGENRRKVTTEEGRRVWGEH